MVSRARIMRRAGGRLLLTAACATTLACRPVSYPAAERVVATVDTVAITESQLEKRTRFYERLLFSKNRPSEGTDSAQFRVTLERLVLDRMIDELLEAHAADSAHISAPLEGGRSQISSMRALSLSGDDSRDAVRVEHVRELEEEWMRRRLEETLIERVVAPRVRVSEEQARQVYSSWSADYATRFVTVRALTISLAAQSTESEEEASLRDMQRLVERARAGADFCQLVAQQSAATCGFVTTVAITDLPPSLARVAESTTTTAIDDPLITPDGQGGKAVVALQVARAPRCPPFDEVRSQMFGIAFQRSTAAAADRWLASLRATAKIETRLATSPRR